MIHDHNTHSYNVDVYMILGLLLMLLKLHPCLSSDSFMIIQDCKLKYYDSKKEEWADEKRTAGGPETFLKPCIGLDHTSKILISH